MAADSRDRSGGDERGKERGDGRATTRRAGGIAGFFRFDERNTDLGTELRAGLTTFMVMAYIIAVNPIILSSGPLEGLGPPFLQTTIATALAAGVLCLAMGLVTNYPFAIAAGLGLNAVVAFDLILNRGFRWEEAMAVIVWEGIIITILVLTGLRRVIMDAIPLSLKRAIAVGIGLFILFIGLVNGGFVQTGAGTPVTLGNVGTFTFVTFAIGLAIALALMARGIRGALLISIVATTVVAIIFNLVFGAQNVGYAPGAGTIPSQWITPLSAESFSTLFAPLGFMLSIFAKPEVPFITVILVIFSLMLSDFFDTMGTVIGVGEEAGLVDENGQLPGISRVLLVDSLGAVAGGVLSTSSNTTYIESAAGVSEGGRTGLTAAVVGVLFLLSILIAPVVGVIPAQATAPALVVVGYLMFTIAREIDWGEIDDLFPALATMIVMPLTYSITNGIAAGFVTFVFLKAVTGKFREVHPLLWVVAAAFVIYFTIPWLQGAIVPPPAESAYR